MDIEKRVKEIEEQLKEVKQLIKQDVKIDTEIDIPQYFPVILTGKGKDRIYASGYFYDRVNGRVHIVGDESNYVEDYFDVKPDWEMVWRLLDPPKWAQFLACSRSGKWCFFERAPLLNSASSVYGSFQVVINENGSKYSAIHCFMPFPDWKNSLSKRPDSL